MNEERFTVMKKFDGSYVICDKGKMLVADDCCDLLNELNKEFEDCEKLLDSKDDFIHKFKRDIEELKISIKLFEDDIAKKDKKIGEQQAEIERLKKPILKDNQETEVRECQFCGEFRTEYHEYEDYSWSAEDYCNAGHDLEDTDPNTCKDYWDDD